ncbi:MAG TPA: LuxR C-terminal-related transcriptional regulator [Candidatus Dormibacteraeota bacterium]|nr:LuxR C-terminal-related transcriptional regulator [Candidatus Dormibacteraeota bacterium]
MARPIRRPGNLPAEPTSFIGRKRELAELRDKLGAARIVSLVGPGGVGKTRLAIKAAGDLARGFRDGAWLIELADVHDPALVVNAMMAALDLRDQAASAPLDVVHRHLQERQLLLVVDNCEHLVATIAPLVHDIATTAPGVTLVATSREPLGIQGEHVVPVPPLQLPAAGADPAATQSEAVTLFVERARAASGSFELTAENQSTVASICRRLDGLPLALELAAVRTRVLSPEQILERLSDRFALLTAGGRAALPRHQTLEMAFDWSYDLLTERERQVFRRLCVFAGRFTLDDAAAVCESNLDVMSSLVDKSLVIKEDARGFACYRLHETLREYASKKLEQAREADEVRERFTDYYVTRLRATALEVRFHLLEWLPWIDVEIDNLRAVLRRCLDSGDSARGIPLATSLAWFWITRATTEGVRWLDDLLASGPSDAETLAWAYFIRGFLAVLQGDSASAKPVLVRGVDFSREHHLPIQLAHALSMASIAALLTGDRASARAYLDEARAVASHVDDLITRLSILQAQSLNAIFEGDAQALVAAATEGERLCRESGDLYGRHMMLLNLGGAHVLNGDLAASTQLYEEALRLAYRVDDRIGQFYLLAALANNEANEGRARVAAQLMGASDTIRAGAGATVMAMLAPFVEQARELAAQALGDARFHIEYEAGRRLSRDEAVRLALHESARAEVGANGREHGALGRREADVARLVAEGLSNKQIAARLFISERTVDSHVRSILNKLGFNSRVQIAAWISQIASRR